VLKSIAFLWNKLFCPFSSTLSPCHQLPIPFSPKLSTDYPSLLHTHHLLTNLLNQLYTAPITCNPWHKHPPLQQQKYVQHTQGPQKPATPSLLPPLTHTTSHYSFSCHPIQLPKFQ
jgi:hypothetical protein